MTNFWRLLGFLRPYRHGVFWSVLLAATAMGTGSIIPLLVGAAVNAIEAADRAALSWLALAIIGAGIFRAVLSVGRRVVTGRVSLGVEHDLRSRLYRHFQDLEIGFFHDHQTGQLMSRATVDLQVVRFFLGYGLTFLLQSVFTIVISAAIMLWLQPDLALLILSTMPFIVFSAAVYGKKARPAVQEVQQRLAELSANVEENVSGIRVIKAFAREPERLAQFKNTTQRVFDQQIFSTRLSGFYNPLLGFIPSMGLAIVMLYGGNQVIDGNLDLGDFTAFYFYMGMLIGPMRTLGATLGSAQRATAAGAR
ncbi:MAG: ABC transporter ATP-binding protein, partial [Solirubrobacterales bacterium]